MVDRHARWFIGRHNPQSARENAVPELVKLRGQGNSVKPCRL
jgi:hypothetical protein